MNRGLTIGIGMLALAATAMPAFGADLPPRIPMKAPIAYAPVMNWTGCYIGGHGGGAWSRSSYTYNNGVVVESFSDNPSSYFAGGQVGCQYQFSNWVLGIEGTWSATKLQQTDASVLLPGRLRTLTIDQIATVTGKAGYAFDNWLLYVKGGFADARIETFAINPATGVSGDILAWQTGWTVGGGLEYMIMPSLVLGVEFNYYRFGFDRNGVATDGTPTAYTGTRAEVYTAMARLSWLFNFGGPVVARY